MISPNQFLQKGGPYVIFGWSICIAAIVLLFRLGDIPIRVWDEARLANNAMEMVANGFSVITTYDGVPDHWNTKPPLMIWLIALSIKAFGPTEFSVRLPSIVAAMGTAIIIYSFSYRYLRKPLVGYVAVLLLLCQPNYVHGHGARSGDYDALLTLWTTIFVLCSYLYFYSRSRRELWLLICIASVSLAFMTKTIQGLILLPGILVYALVYRKQYLLLKSPLFYLGVILFFSLCLFYYHGRDRIDPGYFYAALNNDIVGRFSKALEARERDYWFYLDVWFLVFVVAAIFQYLRGVGRSKKLCVFLSIVTLLYFFVISAAKTKHVWYSIPIVPISAIVMAISVCKLMQWVASELRIRSGYAQILLICFLASSGFGVLALNARTALWEYADAKKYVPDQYNFFLRSAVLQHQDFQKMAIIHPGYVNDAGLDFYLAPALFYANRLRLGGHQVVFIDSSLSIPVDFNVVAFCGDEIKNKLEGILKIQPIHVEDECGAYSVLQR